MRIVSYQSYETPQLRPRDPRHASVTCPMSVPVSDGGTAGETRSPDRHISYVPRPRIVAIGVSVSATFPVRVMARGSPEPLKRGPCRTPPALPRMVEASVATHAVRGDAVQTPTGASWRSSPASVATVGCDDSIAST